VTATLTSTKAPDVREFLTANWRKSSRSSDVFTFNGELNFAVYRFAGRNNRDPDRHFSIKAYNEASDRFLGSGGPFYTDLEARFRAYELAFGKLDVISLLRLCSWIAERATERAETLFAKRLENEVGQRASIPQAAAKQTVVAPKAPLKPVVVKVPRSQHGGEGVSCYYTTKEARKSDGVRPVGLFLTFSVPFQQKHFGQCNFIKVVSGNAAQGLVLRPIERPDPADPHMTFKLEGKRTETRRIILPQQFLKRLGFREETFGKVKLVYSVTPGGLHTGPMPPQLVAGSTDPVRPPQGDGTRASGPVQRLADRGANFSPSLPPEEQCLPGLTAVISTDVEMLRAALEQAAASLNTLLALSPDTTAAVGADRRIHLIRRQRMQSVVKRQNEVSLGA